MSPTPQDRPAVDPRTRDERTFLERHGALIAALALVGAALGIALAVFQPAVYQSSAGVLVTPLDSDDRPASEVLESSADRVNAPEVLNRVRSVIPDAPASVAVETDTTRSVVRLTVDESTPERALRLAQLWASSFIGEQTGALISDLTTRRDNIQRDLADMIGMIGTARLAGDETEVGRLEARRTELAVEQASIEGDVTRLQAGLAAEIVEAPTLPTGRSGVALLPAVLLGLFLGGSIGAGLATLRSRRVRRSTEAEAWLDEHSFGPLDLAELAQASINDQGSGRLDDLAPLDAAQISPPKATHNQAPAAAPAKASTPVRSTQPAPATGPATQAPAPPALSVPDTSRTAPLSARNQQSVLKPTVYMAPNDPVHSSDDRGPDGLGPSLLDSAGAPPVDAAATFQVTMPEAPDPTRVPRVPEERISRATRRDRPSLTQSNEPSSPQHTKTPLRIVSFDDAAAKAVTPVRSQRQAQLAIDVPTVVNDDVLEGWADDLALLPD